MVHCGVGGRGRARQGGVADVAAKVTQSNRGSAKSERERRSLRLVLGPFRTLTHCRRVGRQAVAEAGAVALAGAGAG